MKTKIVYVVASADADNYMEQAIASAWSVRHHTPHCRIEMVCDQDTHSTCSTGFRAQYLSLFDKIHIVNFSPEQSMAERSRRMKTTLRNIIEGDFLFLDTDTIVCADLSYIDSYTFDLGMVLDGNCHFSQHMLYGWVVSEMCRIFGLDVSDEHLYFNSGVIFARDNERVHNFYHNWHKAWTHSFSHFSYIKDQQALMKTDIEHGHIITELSGNLNCQIAESIQYLHTAHVMHLLNSLIGRSTSLSPLFHDIFVQIKHQGLTDSVKDTIINCKSSFISPSLPVTREAALFWREHLAGVSSGNFEEVIKTTATYHLIRIIWHRFPRLMRAIEHTVSFVLRTCKALNIH